MTKKLNKKTEEKLCKRLHEEFMDEIPYEERAIILDNNGFEKYYYYDNTLILGVSDTDGRYSSFYEVDFSVFEEDYKKALREYFKSYKEIEKLRDSDEDAKYKKLQFKRETLEIKKAKNFVELHKDELVKKEKGIRYNSLIKLRNKSLKNLNKSIKKLSKMGVDDNWQIVRNGEIIFEFDKPKQLKRKRK